MLGDGGLGAVSYSFWPAIDTTWLRLILIVQTSKRLTPCLSSVSSLYSVSFLVWLLLLFPKNYLSLSSFNIKVLSKRPQEILSNVTMWLCSGVILLFMIAIILSLGIFYALITATMASNWFMSPAPTYVFVAVGLISALVTIIVSYVHSPSLRERQQLRLFTGGVILTVAPFLFLTLLPQILHAPYFVDARLSTLTFVLFPLSLGYSILRYQVLVFDSYVRRAVAWIVGIVCLAVLSYLVVAISSIFSVRLYPKTVLITQ